MNEVALALRQRFEAAAGKIQWRPAPGAVGKADRIAHLHDEESRVVLRGRGASAVVTVEPGPVGALVLLAETFRRGPPERLEALDAAPVPFGGGALRAVWGKSVAPSDGAREISLDEVVAAARYALV